jgi:hypothetical protein
MGHRFNVRCMMCGRTAGLVHEGVFRRLRNTPPLTTRAGRPACGFCRGSLFLEADVTAEGFPLPGIAGATDERWATGRHAS